MESIYYQNRMFSYRADLLRWIMKHKNDNEKIKNLYENRANWSTADLEEAERLYKMATGKSDPNGTKSGSGNTDWDDFFHRWDEQAKRDAEESKRRYEEAKRKSEQSQREEAESRKKYEEAKKKFWDEVNKKAKRDQRNYYIGLEIVNSLGGMLFGAGIGSLVGYIKGNRVSEIKLKRWIKKKYPNLSDKEIDTNLKYFKELYIKKYTKKAGIIGSLIGTLSAAMILPIYSKSRYGTWT